MTGRVHLAHSWTCAQCDAHGDGPDGDLAARKHEAATGHSTCVRMTPKEAP